MFVTRFEGRFCFQDEQTAQDAAQQLLGHPNSIFATLPTVQGRFLSLDWVGMTSLGDYDAIHCLLSEISQAAIAGRIRCHSDGAPQWSGYLCAHGLPPGINCPRLGQMLGMVMIEDSQGVETEQHLVTRADIPILVQFYWHLETWLQKALFVQLVSHHLDSATRPIMLDLLHAPEPRDIQVLRAQAIALAHLDGNAHWGDLYDWSDWGAIAKLVPQRLTELE